MQVKADENGSLHKSKSFNYGTFLEADRSESPKRNGFLHPDNCGESVVSNFFIFIAINLILAKIPESGDSTKL